MSTKIPAPTFKRMEPATATRVMFSIWQNYYQNQRAQLVAQKWNDIHLPMVASMTVNSGLVSRPDA